jgi:hypothetical protein
MDREGEVKWKVCRCEKCGAWCVVDDGVCDRCKECGKGRMVIRGVAIGKTQIGELVLGNG